MLMTSTRIKICGVQDARIAEVAADAGADAIGLVFVDGSPRQVTTEQARQIVATLPPYVEPIGLFADAAIDVMRDTATRVGLTSLQLHGRETPQLAAQLAPLRVIKAVLMNDDVSDRFAAWCDASENVSGVLFDAPRTSIGALGGGSGRTIDWHAVAKLCDRSPTPPIVLAGGLTPVNVARAIGLVRPYAVDVSSGVESSRGVKDPGLIRAFCQAVRGAG